MTFLDVGVPAEDALSVLRGFHDAERDPNRGGGTYRWTSAVATLEMPWEEAFQFVVSGGRPEGELAAHVATVPNAPTTITVDNPVSQRAQGVQVTIRSTVFNPAGRGLSDDRRDLGARLYRVDFTGHSGPSEPETRLDTGDR